MFTIQGTNSKTCSSTSRNQIRWKELKEPQKILFAKLILIKDDILRYCNKDETRSIIDFKKSTIINIYI